MTAEVRTVVATPPRDRIVEDVRLLREWIAKEPHLPNVEDEMWLETFLYNNKFRLERTKAKLNSYYSLRTKYPQLLRDRDPTSPALLQTRKAVKLGVSHRLEESNCRLFFVGLEANSGVVDAENSTKRWLMIFDALLLEQDRLTNYIIVVDYRNVRYSLFLKILIVLKPALEILFNAFTGRVCALHYIHASPLAYRATEFLKLNFPKRYMDRIYTHGDDYGTLRALVDERILCKDLGGRGPSFVEMEEYTQQLLERHKEWFQEQNDICSNESLRRREPDETEEIHGSFRKLAID
ncbi:unnamed protein product [Bemisia tabaci]|uniref:CRAL-TRIO domain-containing protein n=3 Tax=Bemisia tabaci TaxID=7038 RepID=A0A9P0F7R1_BEMTA|nr:unnamed protein product [Bemisia tabaci]